jgi:hypothetical protein
MGELGASQATTIKSTAMNVVLFLKPLSDDIELRFD